MRSHILISTFIYFVLIAGVLALTSCSTGGNESPVIPDADRTVQVPDPNAWDTPAEEALTAVFLGTAVDPVSGKVVEGYAFYHPVRGNAKPDNPGKPGGGTTSCYGFLASGAKWKTVEHFIINADNSSGISDIFVRDNMNMDVGKWEAAADFDILGNGSLTTDPLEADWNQPDGDNEVYFGSVNGAIAVTVVWGIFYGPPKGRELVEWDMIFNEAGYDWSSSGEGEKMDFENIATHELGHSCGLGDLYTSSCTEETMYGYATYAEIKKQTLEAGDIAGISSLY